MALFNSVALFQRVRANTTQRSDIPFPDTRRDVLVDAEGNKILGREPRKGDFYARRSAVYTFGGTIPIFDPKDHPTDQVSSIRIAYETAELKNRELLEKAIFFLSQTDDGLRLLERARQMKFSFVFDQRRLDARSASGLCDFQNKLIPIHPEATPQRLMLTVKHELQHMENIAEGVGAGTHEALASFQIVSRALEGAARVSEAIAVYESVAPDPKGTPHHFRPPGISQAFEGMYPHMAVALNLPAVQKSAQEKNWKVFAEIVFPTFFKEIETLAFYDQDLLKTYSKDMPRDLNNKEEMDELGALYGNDKLGFHAARILHANFRYKLDHFMVQSTWSHSRIAQLLTIGGQKFLDPEGKKFNLDDPAHIAFQDDAKTRSLFLNFQERLAKLRANGHKVAEINLPPIIEAKKTSSRLARGRRLWTLAAQFTHGITVARAAPRSPSLVQADSKAFSAIVMPTLGSLEAGRAQHQYRAHGDTMVEKTILGFGEAVRTTPYNQSPNDKICFAISHFAYRHRRSISSNADILASKELIDMGLRAPISACPSHYIQDVLIRVTEGIRTSPQGDRYSSFSDSEKRLLQHWQDIASRGANPLDASAVPGHASPDTMVTTYGTCLAQYFKISDSKGALSILSVGELNAQAESVFAASIPVVASNAQHDIQAQRRKSRLLSKVF